MYTVEYFSLDGNFCEAATLDYGGKLHHAVAKVRGLRDNGGPGRLPGIKAGSWDGPILIRNTATGECRILMPKGY